MLVVQRQLALYDVSAVFHWCSCKAWFLSSIFLPRDTAINMFILFASTSSVLQEGIHTVNRKEVKEVRRGDGGGGAYGECEGY